MCKFVMRGWLRATWQFFARKHYVCALCGVFSGSPDALCHPVEKEFEQ